MSNSLLLGASGLEMVGTTTNPEYRLASGFDGGAITPDTVTLTSLLLDGDIVSGARTGNRTWQFTINVFGADRPTLSRNVDTLLYAVASDAAVTFPVVWTPDSCPPTNFTAFRATVTPQKRMTYQDQLVEQVVIEFQTGPFGQSSGTQTVSVLPSGGTPQLQVDGMNSGSFSQGTRDTTTKYEGASSVSFTMSRFLYSTGTYFYTGLGGGRAITSVDLSSYASMSVRFRWPAPVPMNTNGNFVRVTLQLASPTGSVVMFSPGIQIAKGGTAWHLATFDLSAGTAGFDFTNVIQWGVYATSGITAGNPPVTSTAWIDDLRAYPAGSVGNSTPEGMVLTVPAVAGSARTPVTLEVARWPTVQASGNLLTAEDSSFEGATAGTWVGTNCALANSTTNAADGTHSLRVTSTAGGQMSASTVASGTMMTVAPNTPYTLSAASRAAATAEPFFVSVTWLDRAAAVIQTDTTPTVNDSTSAYISNSATITSPSEAAYAYVTVTYTASAAAEVHRIDKIGLVAGSSQAWVLGTGTYRATATLALVNALIHSPPAAQDPDATILAALGAGTVTVPAANMNYDGTYSVIAFLTGSGVSTRTITATFTQKLGATTVGTATVTISVTGAQTIVNVGQVALPLVDIPAENTNSSLVIAVTSGDGSDVISDVALCDTWGQTVLVTGLTGTNTAVYVDAPDPTTGVGPVYASSTDRTNATNTLTLATVSGGPILFDPGDNRLLVASTSGAPGVNATTLPRWLDEALL